MGNLLKKKQESKVSSSILDGFFEFLDKFGKRNFAILTFLIFCIVLMIIVLVRFVSLSSAMVSKMDHVDKTIQEQHLNDKMNQQLLLSMVDENEKRRRMILFMRDQIVAEWASVGINNGVEKAYMIAENNMIESEKYETVDPLLLLAIQWKESHFRDSIVSPVGAIGLSQIMPPTGRMLMRCFQMEYNKGSLYSIKTNIKLSAKYIDFLYQDYPDYGQILAYYNGGHWGRFYYATNNPKLHEETADYVPKVLGKWKSYNKALETYKLAS